MAFGTGSGLLFIGGQDKTIVRLAGVITENRAGFSSSAAADFVSVLARGSWTDVIYTDSGSLVFTARLLTVATRLYVKRCRAAFSSGSARTKYVPELPSNAETLEVTLQYDN